ncbi:hypothetical protein [Dactylosporangium sp. CA-139066]|uniref:hypothetical protein n=1 Tax=Dactylosporangium sp. CA-139066 TaxID=3239930 RepID=UPI003D90EA55
MSALDLAVATGMALFAGWMVYLLRGRRAAARLARVTRAAAAKPPVRPGRAGVLARRGRRALLRRPITASAAVVCLATGSALLAAGVVAAAVAGIYALMALIAVRRHLVRQEAEHTVTTLLDAVDTATEELRAGTIPDGVAAARRTGGPGVSGGRRAIWAEAAAEVAQARLDAAYRLSESLGVPLADLLDRVDADLRSGQTLRGGVAAQLSSAQATAAVLLALPAAGLWVGAALGTHPVHQLLHTPLGATCAVTAVALQCGGFVWTSGMVQAATSEVR